MSLKDHITKNVQVDRKNLNVALSPAEMDDLDVMAEAIGTTRSEFVRALIRREAKASQE